MDVVNQFVDMWNAGDLDGMRSLMTADYSFAEPNYPGPYDADGHVETMADVLERIPDRSLKVTRRLQGASSMAIEVEWIGTVDGSELRLDAIFVFELTPAGDRIQRMRGFYGPA